MNALICVVTTALQFLPPLFIGKRAAAAQQKYMESLDGMNAEIKDTFTGFEVIKSFGVEEKNPGEKQQYVRPCRSGRFSDADYPRKVHCHQ